MFFGIFKDVGMSTAVMGILMDIGEIIRHKKENIITSESSVL